MIDGIIAILVLVLISMLAYKVYCLEQEIKFLHQKDEDLLRLIKWVCPNDIYNPPTGHQ